MTIANWDLSLCVKKRHVQGWLSRSLNVLSFLVWSQLDCRYYQWFLLAYDSSDVWEQFHHINLTYFDICNLSIRIQQLLHFLYLVLFCYQNSNAHPIVSEYADAMVSLFYCRSNIECTHRFLNFLLTASMRAHYKMELPSTKGNQQASTSHGLFPTVQCSSMFRYLSLVLSIREQRDCQTVESGS